MKNLMRALFVFALFFLPGLALAEAADTKSDSAIEGLFTQDDVKGRTAIGRLNVANRAFCTATLVETDLVLTAAHCLFDADTGARVDLRALEFMAGFRNGRAEAYRTVAEAIVHPEYLYSGRDDLTRVAYDVALLRLTQPILSDAVAPIAAGGPELAIGQRVEVVSYAHDRAEAPSLQRFCAVLDRSADVFVLSCDVDFGSSGAPVLYRADGMTYVASVISAKAEMSGKKVAVGMALNAPLANLRAGMDSGSGAEIGGVRLLSGGNARLTTSGGAKFVSP